MFSAVHRAELKPFGIDVVMAAAGNMKTGGPEKTAAELKHAADEMTPEQTRTLRPVLRDIRGQAQRHAERWTGSVQAAEQIIALAEQIPAPSIASVGDDAVKMLRTARELPDEKQDALRLELAGLAA